MWKIFELIGRYFMLMGKVFSRPEKAAIYRRRIITKWSLWESTRSA